MKEYIIVSSFDRDELEAELDDYSRDGWDAISMCVDGGLKEVLMARTVEE